MFLVAKGQQQTMVVACLLLPVCLSRVVLIETRASPGNLDCPLRYSWREPDISAASYRRIRTNRVVELSWLIDAVWLAGMEVKGLREPSIFGDRKVPKSPSAPHSESAETLLWWLLYSSPIIR